MTLHDWSMRPAGDWVCNGCGTMYAPGQIVDPNCPGTAAPAPTGHDWQPDDDKGGDVCSRCGDLWPFEDIVPESEACWADRGPPPPRDRCQKCDKELCEALDKVWDKGAWGRYCGWCWHLISTGK